MFDFGFPERFTRRAASAVTLLYYDGPVAYLLRDDSGAPYLSVYADSEEQGGSGHATWLSVPVSETDALALRDFGTSYAVICQHSGGPFFLHTERWSPTSRTFTESCVSRSEVPADHWPEDWPEDWPTSPPGR